MQEWLSSQTPEDLELAILNLGQAIQDGQDVGGILALWLRVYELLLEIKKKQL